MTRREENGIYWRWHWKAVANSERFPSQLIWLTDVLTGLRSIVWQRVNLWDRINP